MKNLFEVLPRSFFYLFAGKNKEIYAEAVALLYEQYQYNRFGIEYDVMRDLFQEMLETREEYGLSFELEEVEQGSTESYGEDTLFRYKANGLLRKLRDLKWIDIETRDNFRQYIVLPHYTSRILSAFKDLCKESSVEYQRYAFITYQLLTGEETQKRPSFTILEAAEMTEQFIEELRVLVNNMKHHMEQVASKTSITEVLDHHFDEYKTKIVDRSYHRLKTSDHVSRYRQRILETVQRWLIDSEKFTEAVEDGMRSELFTNREDAERQLKAALFNIEEIYRGLDDIFNQIDIKHNQYLRASYDRARYLSQHTHGIDHRLAEILEWLTVKGNANEKFNDILQSCLFNLHKIDHITEKSLYTPRKKRVQRRPEPHVVIDIPEDLKKQLREKNHERLKKAITKKKVQQYVLDKLGDRNEMKMVELAPKTIDEFLYLTFVYLYGYDGMTGYELIRDKDDQVLIVDDFIFNDRKIVRFERVRR